MIGARMGIGISLILFVAGLILAFAVSLDPTPFAGMTVDWIVVGYILFVAGIVGLVWSVFAMNSISRSGDKEKITVVNEDD